MTGARLKSFCCSRNSRLLRILFNATVLRGADLRVALLRFAVVTFRDDRDGDFLELRVDEDFVARVLAAFAAATFLTNTFTNSSFFMDV